MDKLTEQDQQIAEPILCKICKNQFEDPIQLPCSENICYSHLNDFIKVEQENQKRYFDCCFCNKQHPSAKEVKFIANKNLNRLIPNLFFDNVDDSFSQLYNESKKFLAKPIDSDKTFKAKQENDLIKYFSDLRLKVDLRREEIILEIHNASDKLLEEINEIEKDYLNKLKLIHSDFDLKDFKDLKLNNYEEQLKKYEIDLNEWAKISENMNKQDFAKLDENRENSNRLVSSKEKIKFKSGSADIDLKCLFGKITKGLTRTLISGYDDNLIKIWDLENDKCIKTIDAHTNAVRCFELLDDDKLASGSDDKTIKIWDLNTFECLKTLNGHSGGVFCLKKINQYEMMSGSQDSKIKIWDLNSGDCIKTLKGHTAGIVRCLEITNDKKIIISCSDDQTIKTWNYENRKCLRTLTGHTCWVTCLALMNNKIISGSFDDTIKIWNINSGKCEKTLTGHNRSLVYIKPYKENQFLSCSYDGDIKLWETESGICLKTIKVHDERIWSIEISKDGQIFSDSNDGSIKIWNMEDGECLKTLTGHSKEVLSFLYIS